jgi:hypothetical protein
MISLLLFHEVSHYVPNTSRQQSNLSGISAQESEVDSGFGRVGRDAHVTQLQLQCSSQAVARIHDRSST